MVYLFQGKWKWQRGSKHDSGSGGHEFESQEKDDIVLSLYVYTKGFSKYYNCFEKILHCFPLVATAASIWTNWFLSGLFELKDWNAKS